MAVATTRAKTARPPFNKQLVLVRHFAELLGGDFDALLARLAETSQGRDANGRSHFFRALASMNGVKVSRDDLTRYDANILSHEAAIGARRDDFRLTYFQYAACLFTELYLDRLTHDRAGLLADVEAKRAQLAPTLPAYRAADLNRLAIYMSIGAGKTLVMHINLLQFFHYGVLGNGQFGGANEVLLITPNEALSAQHRNELSLSGLDHLRIEVREITKLFVPSADSRGPKKGESLSVTSFEGPNLLLVDEGHKGTQGGADGERAYRLVREALAGRLVDDVERSLSIKPGFTFEYSATFAQVAAQETELFDEYARSVIIEFAYGRFWRGGYGKDFRVLNGRSANTTYDESTRDLVLGAGLLAFYQQVHWFELNRPLAESYRLTPPLAVFLGTSVTLAGGDEPDVVNAVRFLARAVADDAWLAKVVGRAMAISGVQQTLNGDPLDFSYLRSLSLTSAAMVKDLQQRIFGGKGKTEIHRLNDAEIGLKMAGGQDDRFYGVINVGSAKELAARLATIAHIDDKNENKVVGSLFARIDDKPEIKFLLGAKKFIEGWSSWRVAAMGLINVGKKEGSQIIQMFGRGVRLKGRLGDLKRSQGSNDPHVALCETLQVFGLKADYMEQFLSALDREGAARTIIEAPVTMGIGVDELRLQTLKSSGNFLDECVVFSIDKLTPQIMEVSSRVSLTAGIGSTQTLEVDTSVEMKVPVTARIKADAMRHVVELKRLYGWKNLAIAPIEVARLLDSHCRVRGAFDYFEGADGSSRAEAAALVCAETAVSQFYRREERRYLSARMEAAPLLEGDANFPWIEVTSGGRKLAYRLEIEMASDVASSITDTLTREAGNMLDSAAAAAIRAILANSIGLADIAGQIAALLQSPNYQMPNDDLSLPLPRLHCPEHLYAPLLMNQPAKVAKDQLSFDFEGRMGFRATPPLLEQSEMRFVWDLREFWKQAVTMADWADCEIFLLRNLPHHGVGFFQSAGFYPDFMLWMKRGAKQVLAFVEPKGLRLDWPQEKIAMLKELDGLGLSLPVRGFMVTPTDATAIQGLQGWPLGTHADKLAENRILLQDDPHYILTLLTQLKKCL